MTEKQGRKEAEMWPRAKIGAQQPPPCKTPSEENTQRSEQNKTHTHSYLLVAHKKKQLVNFKVRVIPLPFRGLIL